MRIKNIFMLIVFFIVLPSITYSKEETTAEKDIVRPQGIPEEVSIMGITLGKSLGELNIKECKYKFYVIKRYDLVQQEGMCWQGPSVKRMKSNYVEIHTLKTLSFTTSTGVFFDEELSEDSFEKHPIMEIKISIGSDRSPEMYKLLKDKFGEPISYEKSIIQNTMGVRFDRFIASWLINGNSIWFTDMSDIDTGLLRATHKTKVQAQEEVEKEGRVKDKERF